MRSAQRLRELQERKAALQASIAEERAAAALAAAETAAAYVRPKSILHRGVTFWRTLPPETKWAALPVVLGLLGKVAPRISGAPVLAKLTPLLMYVARMAGRRAG